MIAAGFATLGKALLGLVPLSIWCGSVAYFIWRMLKRPGALRIAISVALVTAAVQLPIYLAYLAFFKADDRVQLPAVTASADVGTTPPASTSGGDTRWRMNWPLVLNRQLGHDTGDRAESSVAKSLPKASIAERQDRVIQDQPLPPQDEAAPPVAPEQEPSTQSAIPAEGNYCQSVLDHMDAAGMITGAAASGGTLSLTADPEKWEAASYKEKDYLLRTYLCAQGGLKAFPNGATVKSQAADEILGTFDGTLRLP